MEALEIRHATRFVYRTTVALGPHRLRLRPREGAAVRLVSFELTTSPPSFLSWAQDVYGNAVATARFETPTDVLEIESVARVELFAPAWPVFAISAEAATYPFAYDPEDRTELGVLIGGAEAPASASFGAWVASFVAGRPTDTLSLLGDLNAGVFGAVAYEARESEGTQTPEETLERGRGSCRDLAVLFVAAVRVLGLGARIVSGYLHDKDRTLRGSGEDGSTHAWAEVYIPGAGWIVYDPTNRRVGGANLVPVAAASRIERAAPIAGTFSGPKDALVDMTVSVRIS